MRTALVLLCALLCTLVPCISATALSFMLSSQEECVYAIAPKPEKKIGFYFAVQAGGQFDLSFVAKDPKGNVVIEGKKQRQGDYVFAAQHGGEYSFCFINDQYLSGAKRVYIDVLVEDEHLVRPSLGTPTAKDTTEIENSVFRLNHLLATYARNQKYYRTRENRNVDTVITTQERVWWFAVVTALLIVAMSLGQVYVVRAFFATSRKAI